ncbi:hypothetical protein CF386_06110 [Paraphotobacterium marinum]|uniref:Transporter n=1 Tax=Paraphotobacterium marinum TaxID=1755811 RepID=A0A220VDW6_9GAMM|nr:AEC family transporter [Paraphotobacterium marinum]ASK78608.1 hypothetical protein CF386_06110 [Paraphotobacterium marinum]
MEAIFSSIFSFLLIILLGYYCSKKEYFANDFYKDLINFVLNIALPCLIFIHLAQKNISSLININFVISYSLILLVTFIFSFITLKRIFGGSVSKSSLRALTSSFSNTGYFGLPILTTLIGPEVISPIVIGTFINDIFLMPLAIFIVELDLKNDSKTKLHEVFLNVFKKSVVISAILGIVFSIFKIKLPFFLSQCVNEISLSTSSLALFSVGMILQKQKVKLSKEIFSNILIKAILQPMLAVVFVYFFKVGGLWGIVTILLSALPVGATPVLFSQKYKNYEKESSSALLLTTLLSLFTISFIILFYKEGLFNNLLDI